MKSKTKKRLAITSVAALAACVILSVSAWAAGYIGEDAAVDAVLRRTGGSREDLEDLNVSLLKSPDEKHPPVYEVQYRDSECMVRYLIDAKTGSVLRFDGRRLKSDDDTDGPADADDTSEDTAETFGIPRWIPMAEAESIAHRDAGAGQVATTSRLERHNGSTFYRVSFSEGGIDYCYLINAETGEINTRIR